jgi:hypothetical protein
MQTLQYYLTTATHVFNVYRGPGHGASRLTNSPDAAMSMGTPPHMY